ncbi:Iron-sulfur clusters transporter atm1, mitochondrial [Mycoemilia scoparia]|uniref:Iron-sulfur clusters transporter ATM1, mitochondrial n=1 Tax=Mycoemilia scoparia TaxID=417184 RepID=A0A9W8DS82_9FUNG|nr:Iron-sulfur clusters transporter atm1, mitochondrial [Mycoemilia scoparia]
MSFFRQSTSSLAILHSGRLSIRRSISGVYNTRPISSRFQAEKPVSIPSEKINPSTTSALPSKTVGLDASDAKKTTAGGSKPKDIAKVPIVKDQKSVGRWSPQLIRSIFKYVWPAGDWGTKSRVIIALSLMGISKALNVQVPIAFKHLIDSLNIDVAALGGVLPTVSVALLLGYGAARLGATALQELRNSIFSMVQQNAVKSLEMSVYKHLLNMDLKFHLTRETGGLSRAIDRGTKGISFILSSVVIHFVPTLLEIGIVCGILANKFGSEYAIVAASTMAIYVAFTLGVTQWRTKFRQQMNAADNKAASLCVDSLINFESVKYFNAEKYEAMKYDRALEKYKAAALKTAGSLAFLNAGQNAIFSASLTLMMYLASKGVASGALSVGDIVMVNGLVFQLSLPLNFLGSIYREMSQAVIDMGTLFQLENAKPAIREIHNAKPLKMDGGSIEFKNVSFAYTPERQILKDISFTIPAGQRVAFVGPSGCGKSTILRLLFRFYDPDSGSIKIDGQPVNQVTLESLRKEIGVVPQDTALFNTTLFQNIKYGDHSATETQVYEAAKKARIHDTIMKLPNQYDTQVGERGLMISGGEKQRVALSRAILKRAPIIFFDEATSALDTHTENEILANIREILSQQQCTAIFIAHRLRTISDADIIFVLKDGVVVEQGRHEELLALNGIYRDMWDMQEIRGTNGIRD